MSAQGYLSRTVRVYHLHYLGRFFLYHVRFSVASVIASHAVRRPNVLRGRSRRFARFASVRIPSVISIGLSQASVRVVRARRRFSRYYLSNSYQAGGYSLLTFFRVH